MGSASRLMKKSVIFCENKTSEIIKIVDTSKKIDRMVDANASMILLASVKRDTISPVLRIAKKDIGR